MFTFHVSLSLSLCKNKTKHSPYNNAANYNTHPHTQHVCERYIGEIWRVAKAKLEICQNKASDQQKKTRDHSLSNWTQSLPLSLCITLDMIIVLCGSVWVTHSVHEQKGNNNILYLSRACIVLGSWVITVARLLC